MALGSSLLQFFSGGSRECLFDAKNSVVDISVVCHDVRGLDLLEEEKVFVTLKDMRKHGHEQLVPLGVHCHLRSLNLDASILLRVWAARDETAVRLKSETWGRRNCGELRIPLDRLILHFDGMLYQTWVSLDCPGLNDSVASVGLGDHGGSFEQKLVDGPRQLFQPRAFLSIGKTADFGATKELLLTSDATPEARAAHWGPLLRSQQQHAVMSAALHLQGPQVGDSPLAGEQSMKAAARLQELRGRVQGQAQSIEALRREVREAEERLLAVRVPPRSSPQGDGPRTPLRERFCPGSGNGDSSSSTFGPARKEVDLNARTVALEAEIEKLRAGNSRQQARAGELRAELDSMRQHANNNVDRANEQIRALRRDRDENVRESQHWAAEVDRLLGQKQELIFEQGESLFTACALC